MSLGTNIYHLRKEKGYSQEELANRCNVSRQAISKWEADEVMPDTNNLLTLSKLFHITIDELINNPVNTKQSDVFDKSVLLVKKHWAKIGYRFILSGVLAVGLSIIEKATLHYQNALFHDFIGTNMDFNDIIFSFILVVGVILFSVGLCLVIYDYKKNHPKNI